MDRNIFVCGDFDSEAEQGLSNLNWRDLDLDSENDKKGMHISYLISTFFN